MIDWSLVVPGVVAVLSIAALMTTRSVINYRKWVLEKSEEHVHLWSLWDDEPIEQRVNDPDSPGSNPIDIRERFSRKCEICGERVYKVYSRKKETWL